MKLLITHIFFWGGSLKLLITNIFFGGDHETLDAQKSIRVILGLWCHIGTFLGPWTIIFFF